ncbi:hypothetical protein AB5J72_20275 [Streptomyces sp. CG1]|uniref:hypothetical protein n=1 Tax=Streptomyces sp. CG1 TaxID=1287523 RepID=UPI0034E2340C
MQGHGYGQPVKQPPHTAWLVLLRVLFVAIGLFSIGFLAWAMMLRLAAVTRRSLDWGLFIAVLAADILSIALLSMEPGDEIRTTSGNFAMFLLLGTLVATIAYYLAADIRHFMQREQAYAAQRTAQAAYAYRGPASPHTPPPMPHTPVPRTPPATPPPQRPAPTHIEQVRAELDELSDYLRKHDGRHDSHESGR